MKRDERIRLAILLSHPIQYFAPLFRALAQRPEVDLTVVFCRRLGLDVTTDREFGVAFRWDVPLVEGYRYVFLANYGASGGPTFTQLVNPGVMTHLARARYDAIIVHGYEHFTKWLTFATASALGTRLFLRGESTLLHEVSSLRRLTKRAVLGSLMRAIDGALYLGTENRRFYEHYGLAPSRLTHVPYVVDNEYFADQRRRLAPARASIWRDWGIPRDVPVVLAAGKLVPKKQPLHLLEAFAIALERAPAFLLYAGDGHLRAALETRAKELGIDQSVRVTGFLNQSEIARAYVAADMLVLASRTEPWGLVVNEAMNFALPVIATNAVGSVADLVTDGENGFVVDPADGAALAAHIARLASDGALRTAFGARSLERIRTWDIDRAVEGIVVAVTRKAS